MSKYTWLLDPGHGGIIDGVYQTAGKRSPAFPDGTVLYEGDFNRKVADDVFKFCKSGNFDVVNVVDSLEDVPLRTRVARANEIHRNKQNCICLLYTSDAADE